MNSFNIQVIVGEGSHLKNTEFQNNRVDFSVDVVLALIAVAPRWGDMIINIQQLDDPSVYTSIKEKKNAGVEDRVRSKMVDWFKSVILEEAA
jgi:hypothetical protein